jgi:histone deacetylase complex regulatory component SIN3
MMLLLERERRRGAASVKQQIAYRMDIESMLPEDDGLYHIRWVGIHYRDFRLFV